MYCTTCRFPIRKLIHDHYNFAVGNITFSHCASWLSAHGIPIGSTASDALESFACSFRNRAEGMSSPDNTTFATWPHNAEAVVDDGDITQWALLEHAPLRPGLSSRYPHRPASPNARPPTPSPLSEDTVMET
ncbi:hypothetical protein B0H11DRAFT_2259612 [Mycena galericulata]|nr:hypothetical protein B0H11DRAFT_2259612 [Mycena galericulata]